MRRCGRPGYFCIFYTLVAVWRKIESLGITEKDVADAVRWARRPKNRVKSSAK
jgi:hypothetical protein